MKWFCALLFIGFSIWLGIDCIHFNIYGAISHGFAATWGLILLIAYQLKEDIKGSTK